MMERSTALAVLVSVTLCATTWFLKSTKDEMVEKKKTPPFDGMPLAPNPHWFFGHMLVLFKQGFRQGQKKVFVDFADENGLCSCWFLSRSIASVLLAKDVKTVLVSSSHRTPSKMMARHNHQLLGQKGLTSLMGKEWKLYRTAVHKAFTPATLKQSQQSINLVAETLVNSLLMAIRNNDSSLSQSVLPLMKMATIDTFGYAALGIKLGCCAKLQPSFVAEAFEFMTEEYTRRIKDPLNPANVFYSLPTPKNRLYLKKRRLIRSFLMEQINKARKSNESSNKNDLLTSILKLGENQNDLFTDSAVTDILMTLLFGGYDTTSVTLSYALFLLATHPEVEKECLDEIASVLGNTAGLDDGPDALPYTKAVLLESIRIFPPVIMTARCLEKPLQLRDNVTLDQGTDVFIPIWSIQRDPRNFPQPESLRPDRWVRRFHDHWEERPVDDYNSSDIPPANRDAFCAFAAGARSCVGRSLALQETVTILAFLIRKIKFTVSPGYDPSPEMVSMVQNPKDGIPMTMTQR